jgi:tRNA dimethylallyltransferase
MYSGQVKTQVIAVIGPTASGKTALSIVLAKRFGGEIVSADSRQIYRGMDIGTAKPTVAERRAIPHHLIDIKYPDEDYTVATYQRDAIAAISGAAARGALPILVGGTGLYVRAVLENLVIPKTAANPELRARIEKDIARLGLEAMFKRLVALDPEAANVVDPKNPRRIVRALEVAITTGEPFTAQRKKNEPLYNALVLGFNPPAEVLRKRINQRVDEMMRAGLVDETVALIKKYGRSPVACDAIGYREVIAHLDGTLTLEGAIAAIKLNTWHYAKRQMTWFKRTPGVRWVKNPNEAADLVQDFLR